MTRRRPRSLVLGLCLLAGGALGATARAIDAPNPAGAPKEDSSVKPKRTMQDIMQDFQQTGQQLHEAISTPDVITDAQKRKEAAPKAIPVLKKMVGFARELRQTDNPQGKMIADQVEPELVPILALFGDEETNTQLQKQAKSSDKGEALRGQSGLLMVKWIQSSKDAAAQEKLLGDAEKLAKDNPDSEPLTQQLFGMGQMGPASGDMADKIQDIAAGMKTRTAGQMKEQLADQKKLRSLENKPLTIAGVRDNGNQFSSGDWKGKVILVDFWATWCGPCRAELPRVKKAYADFHDKGLEVLGVSCDNEADALAQFLKANPDMPWPQLFDAKTPGWHPLAKSYGITGIPTMFLIDKKGVVRSVTARENFEEMIPKLLEEKS
jgi:thiol-disulfide isomerase/thioredoxin